MRKIHAGIKSGGSPEVLQYIILILIIFYGLIAKLLEAKSIFLNSDSVFLGRLTFDFWVHKNFLLDGWHLASTAPYLFTEWIPFNLIPQIFSDYDPEMLKLMSFIIYIMVIIVFSLLVYMITNNIANSLIFSAMMANINIASSIFYLTSAIHVGALFFTGLFLVFILKFFNTERIKVIKFAPIFVILINLMVFSDSIMLAWFVIPSAIGYYFFLKNKNLRSDILIILICISSMFTYVLKTHFISDFINNDPRIIFSFDNILKNSLLYIGGLSIHIYGDGEPSMPKYLIIASYLILLFFSIRSCFRDKNAEKAYLYSVFGISSFLILIFYICTSYAADLHSAIRYLLFTTLSINLLISLNELKNKLVVLSIIIILSFGIASNYCYISNINLNENPNQNEHDLLNYLKNNNLKYGYGDYWDANILTYLSKSNIIIKPVCIENSQLIPFKLHSPESLFDQSLKTDGKVFLLSRADNVILKKVDVDSFVESAKPLDILHFKNYNIYIYPMDILYLIKLNGDILKRGSRFITLAALDKNWYGLENWDNNSTRWINNNASLYVYSENNFTTKLSFMAQSFYFNRVADIYVRDILVARRNATTGIFNNITIPIKLKRGKNAIRFQTIVGCDRPSNIPVLNSNDFRCISLAFQKINIE